MIQSFHWANSVDSDQTAPGSLIRVYTVILSASFGILREHLCASKAPQDLNHSFLYFINFFINFV